MGGLFNKGSEAGSDAAQKIKASGEAIADSSGNVVDDLKHKGENVLETASDFVGGLFNKGSEAGSDAAQKIKASGEAIKDVLSEHDPK